MKFLLPLLLACLIPLKSQAMFDGISQALLTRANNASPLEGIGTVLNKTRNHLRATYDFAVLGGNISTASSFSLVDDQGNAAILPFGSIVTQTWSNVLTTVTGTAVAAAQVNLQLLAASDLCAAVNVISLSTSALSQRSIMNACVQTGVPTTFVGPVTAAAGTQLKINLSSASMTAGKFEFFIDYVIQ